MSNFEIKTKILNVKGVDFKVPESFEIDRDVSRKFSPAIVAIDNKSKKRFFVKILRLDIEPLHYTRIDVASLLAHFYLTSSKTVKLQHLILPDDFPKSKNVFKIVEYMETTLLSIINSSQTMTPNHVRYFLYQILLHLNYLHSHNLSLSYFTPRSFLVNSDCELKLSKPLHEFRMNCNRIHQIKQYNDCSDCTRWYLPPESFIENESNLKSDMWGLGCIFYELVMRKPLFPGKDDKMMIKIQIEGLGKLDESDIELVKSEKARNFLIKSEFKMNSLFDRIEGVCDDGMFILRNLLVFNPDKRMSAIECLIHPYFEEFFIEEDLFFEFKNFDRVFDALYMEEGKLFSRVAELAKEIEGSV